jgi:hypothetical protein
VIPVAKFLVFRVLAKILEGVKFCFSFQESELSKSINDILGTVVCEGVCKTGPGLVQLGKKTEDLAYRSR